MVTPPHLGSLAKSQLLYANEATALWQRSGPVPTILHMWPLPFSLVGVHLVVLHSHVAGMVMCWGVHTTICRAHTSPNPQ